jgi:uncharacterized protein
MTVAVLGDLHVGSPWNGLDNLRRVVDLTNGQHPDLIVLVGDYVIQGVVGGRFVPPAAMVEPLRKLSAPLGVYAVLGNHDWWLDSREVSDAMRAAGITVLEDRAIELRQPRGPAIWLIGISDAWEGPHDIGKAVAAVPLGAPSIAITHNPDLFPRIPESIGILLAGHTHGGQVAVPILGRPIVPSSFGERYAIGHVQDGNRQLFVTPGIGTSIIPVRFRVPPEISLLDLH